MNLETACVLGSNLEWLKAARGTYVKGDNLILDAMKWLLSTIKENNISLTTQYEVEEAINKFESSYKEKEIIRKEDAEQLTERAKIWYDRIDHELSNIITIDVFTDGTLNYKKLLIGGKGFFPNDVWDRLSDMSKSDLNDACNCLLTKSWTPAVIISLRAAEDSIRNFYKLKTGQDTIEKGWKKILEELKNIEGINKTFLGYFDYIREVRNTAGHPDQIFDQMEAERVFHQVVSMMIVINRDT